MEFLRSQDPTELAAAALLLSFPAFMGLVIVYIKGWERIMFGIILVVAIALCVLSARG